MTETAIQIGVSQERKLKRTYKHLERANLNLRSPGLPDEAVAAAERIEERIAELDAKVSRAIARRREITIEVGRALNELKEILGHGKWQRHFEEAFVPQGLHLRTAERYMKRASKADAVSKNDSLSILEPATDKGAQEIKDATLQAQTAVGAPSDNGKLKKKPLRPYSLVLRMAGDEHSAMEMLRKLPAWPHAEKKIVHFLRGLWVEYGIVNKDARRHP